MLRKNTKSKIDEINRKLTETFSLLGGDNITAQQNRWRHIVERYFKEVDEDSFNSFIKEQKKEILWDCEYVIMQVGLIMASLGMDEGFDTLKSVGIVGEYDTVERKVRGKITNHELKHSDKQINDTPPTDFFLMLARVRKLGYNIDSNILLQEWIGILKDIRNERNNSET